MKEVLYNGTMEGAILNFEIFHRKCEPLNTAREKEGLPFVSREYLEGVKEAVLHEVATDRVLYPHGKNNIAKENI